MGKSLQTKLDDAVSKISELTDVLESLKPELTTEYAYEQYAVQTMAPEQAAMQKNQFAGGNQETRNADLAFQKTGAAKSDYLTSSQVTHSRRM